MTQENTRRRRLHILHKLPTPYNDDLFRALHAAPNIDLQVHHLWRGSARRPWMTELATGYPNRYMKLFLGLDWTMIRQAWTEPDSLFMIGDWARPSTLAPVFTRLIRNAPVAIWADTPQEQLKRPLVKRVLRRAFLRWLLQRVDAIFASGIPAERALRTLGAPPQSIVDLQFMVDLERPSRARAVPAKVERAKALRRSVGCDASGIVFLISGTIDFQKKAQDFGLRAFAKVSREAQHPLGLLVAGAGEDEPKLRQMVRDLGLEQSVRLLGWQEPDEMDSVYMAADVLFHPAHYDPFPLVVIEAMSWGKAVIGSDASGSVEQRVREGINGYIFKASDFESLVSKLDLLIEQHHKIEALSRAARETAETWPFSRGVKVIEETLNRLLDTKATPQPYNTTLRNLIERYTTEPTPDSRLQ